MEPRADAVPRPGLRTALALLGHYGLALAGFLLAAALAPVRPCDVIFCTTAERVAAGVWGGFLATFLTPLVGWAARMRWWWFPLTLTIQAVLIWVVEVQSLLQLGWLLTVATPVVTALAAMPRGTTERPGQMKRQWGWAGFAAIGFILAVLVLQLPITL